MRFGIESALLCLALVLFSAWKGAATAALCISVIGVIFGLTAALWPQCLAPLASGVRVVGRGFSKVMDPVLLAILYFGVLTPLGTSLRLASRGSRGGKRQNMSYWADRGAVRGRSDLKRMS